MNKEYAPLETYNDWRNIPNALMWTASMIIGGSICRLLYFAWMR